MLQALWRQIDDLHAALEPGYFRPPGASPRPSGYAAGDPHATMLVAEDVARVGAPGAAPLVGAVLVRLYDTPADPTMVARRRAHIEALIVDQSHRRAGVGTALMNAVTTWARDRGAEEIVLTVWAGNAAAEAFYQRLGYRRISQALGKAI